MKKLLLLLTICLVLSACYPATHYCDLNRMVVPDGQKFEKRQDYLKASGLDKNPVNPVVTITVMPHHFKVPYITPLTCDRYGNAELCIAKAIKQVIPNSAVYFELKPESVAVFTPTGVDISGNGLLIRRGKKVKDLGGYAEIYGNLKIKEKTIELIGGTFKTVFVDNAGLVYWEACLDLANQIAEILIKEGYLKESQVRFAGKGE